MNGQQRKQEIKEYIEKLGALHPKIIDVPSLAKKYNVATSTVHHDIKSIKKDLDYEEPEIGVIVTKNLVINDEEVEQVWIGYKDKGIKTVSVNFFPNRQITTITEVFENPDTGEIEYKIVKKGMTREEIGKFFPARPTKRSKQGAKYNLRELIRSIIYEAYRKEGLTGKIEGGNVRHFWYTHLKPVLVGVLGLTENDSVSSTVNEAWKGVINSGLVTYEDMNIIGGKETGRISIVRDSPFSNLIVAVEKLNFFDDFKWIPQLFNCTLITAGGDPSRTVIRRFILDLKELDVDLNQQFHMCVASDLDPSGYYIQEAFKDQLELAIKYYGGTGKVEIHRLFVRKDQVSSTLLESQAIPWQYGNESQKNETKVKKETIWKNFCDKIDGGLYIPVPDGWTGDIVEVDGKSMVRALLEMDAFSTDVIEKAIIKELLKIIRDTNDESKIMIPEIMRVFDEKRKDVAEELYDEWKKKLIDPLKEEFLKDTDAWEYFIENERNKVHDDITSRYDSLLEEKEQEKRERTPELFDKKEDLEKQVDELEDQISKLRDEIDDVEDEISDECRDINDEMGKLRENRNEELESVKEDYDFRMKRYNEFKEKHIAVLNPVEQALKSDIEKRLSQGDMHYFFRDLENREEIRKSISGLLTNSELLLEENISCFNQPVPTFKGENFLEQASQNKDLNIGKVRDSFSNDFLEAMYGVIETDAQDLAFVLSKTIEMKDLAQEVKEAMEKTEKELDKVGESNE